MSEKACQWYNCDRVHSEDNAIRHAGEVGGDADWDEDEQDVDPAGDQDVPDDIEEADHNRLLLWLWLLLLSTSRGRIVPICSGVMAVLGLGWSWCSG